MLAIITGASSGIGAAFARQLAARGWDLLLIARREDRLQELASYLAAWHRVAVDFLPADLTEADSLASVAARVRESANLGLLINNAGFGVQGSFFEADLNQQQRMHRLHVDATVALSQAALANLVPRARSGTGIINVSSVAAFLPFASYGATKTWMNAFTESLAYELAAVKSPVTLQALCPGYTLTEFHDVIRQDRSAIPTWMWLTADFVVAESLRAFKKKTTIVVPGWRYKALVGAAGMLKGGVRRRVMTSIASRYRRQNNNAQIRNGSK